jgi:hypothetical protein
LFDRLDLDAGEEVKRIVYHHDPGNAPYHFGRAEYAPDDGFDADDIARFIQDDLEWIEVDAGGDITISGHTADHHFEFRYELEELAPVDDGQ